MFCINTIIMRRSFTTFFLIIVPFIPAEVGIQCSRVHYFTFVTKSNKSSEGSKNSLRFRFAHHVSDFLHRSKFFTKILDSLLPSVSHFLIFNTKIKNQKYLDNYNVKL